jgi:hypothetical protein
VTTSAAELPVADLPVPVAESSHRRSNAQVQQAGPDAEYGRQLPPRARETVELPGIEDAYNVLELRISDMRQHGLTGVNTSR